MDHQHQHGHRHYHSRRLAQPMDAGTNPSRTTQVLERTIVELAARATTKCADESQPGCTKPTVIPTLPIVLGVCIPLVGISVILFFLHRRHKRKLLEEDKQDSNKYSSDDLGVDVVSGSRKNGGKGPQMTITMTEKKRMSFDLGSPYIMHPGLNGSHESLHSLSRTITDSHDPYAPVNFIKDDSSVRSASRNGRGGDNGSVYTSSSEKDRMNGSLLKNAQTMSHSFPPRGESKAIPEIKLPEPAARSPSPLIPSGALRQASPPPAVIVNPASPDSPGEYKAFKPSNAPQLPPHESAGPALSMPSALPRIQSQAAELHISGNTTSFMSDSSYGDGFKITPPSPPQTERTVSVGPLAPEPLRPQSNMPIGLGVETPDFSTNRLSMSLRPLPPDDPNENPEERANRIRSFYKEYFDDSKPEPVGGHVYNDYAEDYGSEYLDGTVFDPRSGAFVVSQPQAPYAQPVTRRAMTPPPRAPPRFRSGSNPRGPHMSNGSERFPPRGQSSMSARPVPAKAPLPPPTDLNSLPTPAKLTEDSMVFNAIDFAPPVSYRERQNGARPDSPLGSPRPYSPAVRPHTPLVGSFDDLAVMPSPHLLRQSSTFTALDFAPPPRFRDPGSNASDAGSIRSNRSGMSNVGRMAVRAGVNRVSKIPKEILGTKDDIATSLRPQMSMVAPA